MDVDEAVTSWWSTVDRLEVRQRTAVAVIGEPPPEWASLQRTYRAYRYGLAAIGYEVVTLAEEDPVDPTIAAVINFWGSAVWRRHIPADIPRLVCLHGGVVINQREIEVLLGALDPRDAVLANCDSDIALLAQLDFCPPQLELLRLPVDPSLQPWPRDQARRYLQLPAEGLLIGFVGRLVPHKGLHHFLRTVAYCRERYGSRVQGIVLGDFWPDYSLLGEMSRDYRPYIAGLIAAHGLDRSLFFPALETGDDGVGAVYSAVDLVVHPTTSPDENFGYVPLEAWKCGTAVVATAYGGLKDCLPKVSTITAVPTWPTDNGTRFDLHRLMSVTAKGLANPGWLVELGERGASLIDREYAPAPFETRLREIIEDAITRSRRGGLPTRKRLDESIASRSPEVLQWSDVTTPVAAYTSSHPSLRPASARTYLWPGQYQPEERAYRFDDPAWPLSVRVDLDEASRLAGSPSSGWGIPPLMETSPVTQKGGPALQALTRRGIVAWTDPL